MPLLAHKTWHLENCHKDPIDGEVHLAERLVKMLKDETKRARDVLEGHKKTSKNTRG